MTVEQMDRFPALWEEFTRRLQEKYIEVLANAPVKNDGAFRDKLSNVYSDIGSKYWLLYDEDAKQWLEQYNERFFASECFNFQRMLYESMGLNTPIQQSMNQQRPAALDSLSAEELYALVIEPHLNERSRTMLELFSQVKHALLQPVPYELILPLEELLKLQLTFASCHRKSHRSEPLEEYPYAYNGREHRGTETLWEEKLEDLSGTVRIGRDAYGEKVLKTYRGIPTFDDSDREWDSEEEEYLLFDGKDVHLVIMRGGYRTASLTFYEKLLTADLQLKPIFEKLDWPEMDIKWI